MKPIKKRIPAFGPTGLISGLLLIFILVGSAAQAVDRAELVQELTNLEAGLDKLDKHLTNLKSIAATYQEKEMELSVILSMSRGAEAAGPAAVEELKKAAELVSQVTWQDELTKGRQGADDLARKTSRLKAAHDRYVEAVRDAAQQTKEICGLADKLGTAPPPPQEQIEVWGKDTGVLLQQVENQVAGARQALDDSQMEIARAVRNLGLLLDRLRTLDADRAALRAEQARLGEIVNRWKAIYKDLARAEELAKELLELQIKFHRVPSGMTSEVLAKRRQEVVGLRTRIPQEDQNLPARHNRIEERLAALERGFLLVKLPGSIPRVPMLDPQVKDLLAGADKVDLAGQRTALGQVGRFLQEALQYLTAAEGAQEAARKNPGAIIELQRARECQARLGEAAAAAVGALGDLGSKLDKAAAGLERYLEERRQTMALNEELKTLGAGLNQVASRLEAIMDAAKQTKAGLVEWSPPEPLPELERMAAETAGLEQAFQKLALATQTAALERDLVCEQAARAGTGQGPTGEELEGWQKEAEARLRASAETLNKTSWELETQRRVLDQAMAALEAVTGKAKGEERRLTLEKNQVLETIQVLTREQEDFNKAVELSGRIGRQREELSRMLEAGLKELGEVRREAESLAAREDSTIARSEVDEIVLRSTSLEAEYRAAPVPEVAAWPEKRQRYFPLLKAYNLGLARLEKRISQIQDLRQKIAQARSDAERVSLAGQMAVDNSPQVLESFETCRDNLRRARAEGSELEDQTRAKIKACDLAGARALIDQMAHGPVKDRLLEDYRASQALENRLRSMVEEARALYQDCRLNKALEILNQALGQAKCQDHRKSLNEKIELAKRRLEYEKTTIALFNEANKLYQEGKYQDALARLQKAKKRSSCERFKDSLGDKIAIVQARIGSGSDPGQETDQPPEERQQLGDDNRNRVVPPPTGEVRRFEGQLERTVAFIALQADREKCPVSRVNCSASGPWIKAELNTARNEVLVTVGGSSLITLSTVSKVGMKCGSSMRVKDGWFNMTLTLDQGQYVYTPNRQSMVEGALCRGERCQTEAKAWLSGSSLNFEFKGTTGYLVGTGCGWTTRQWIWKAEMREVQ